MLLPATLIAVAREGKVFSGLGYRQTDKGYEILDVASKSGITLGDLIVPVDALKKMSLRHERPVTQPETPVTPEGGKHFRSKSLVWL